MWFDVVCLSEKGLTIPNHLYTSRQNRRAEDTSRVYRVAKGTFPREVARPLLI